MKTIYNKFILILSILLVAYSCDDKEYVYLNEGANTQVSLSANSVTLTEDNAADQVLTVSWTLPDFGFDAAPVYRLMIDVSGNDFSAAQILPMANAQEKTFTGAELNAKLLALGLTPNEESSIDFVVQTRLSDSQVVNSAPVSLLVTPYSSILDLSTTWGVVGSATPGGWGSPDIKDLPFYTTSTAGVYVAYVSLRTGEIKFRENNDWANNLGDDGADGTLEANGANISVTAGTYKITFNTNDSTYTIENYSWGIVGSGTPNGWDGPDMKLEYNSYQDNWKAVVTLVDGEIKFRFNNDWGTNYGDDGVNGSLELNGANIAVSAGHYLVTVDFNTLEYTLEEVNVWGLVGSATANGWDGPDQKFLPDFGIYEGRYYIHGAVLVAGEIKIRENDAWAVNYGDDGADGTLEANGANIAVGAGTYEIVVDFSVSPPTIAIYPWQ